MHDRIRVGLLLFSGIAPIATDAARAQPGRNQLAPILVGEKWVYADARGNTIFRPRFDAAGPFSEGLAPVEVGGQWGFIDLSGKQAVKPRFQLAGPFSEGLAFVRVDNRFGFVNRSGELVIRPVFAWVGSFSEGLAPFRDNAGRYGFLDTQGKPAIQPNFTRVQPFAEGLAAVRIDGKIGYIDHHGNRRIAPSFSDAGSFSEGLCWVRTDERKAAYIGRDGKLAFDREFDRAFPFRRGLAAVKSDGKYGLINHRGDFVVKPTAESVRLTADGVELTSANHIQVVVPVVNLDGTVTYASEHRHVKWMKSIKLLSDPVGARVYRVTWLQRKYASDIQDLLTDANAVTESDTTNVATWLDGRTKWTIIFANGQGIREKQCIPGVHLTVKVEFP